MIGYVTLGTNDLPRAAVFYDAIAKHFGVGRMMDFETFIAWGDMGGAPGVAATKPFDEQALFRAGQVLEDAAGRFAVEERWW